MDIDSLDINDYGKSFEIIDLNDFALLLPFDDLDNDSLVFNMTSLSALMLLSHNGSRSSLNESTTAQDECEKCRLSLAYERLHSMPKIIQQELSPFIQILDISFNEFEDLSFLRDFKHLTTLICDHNNLNSNVYLPFMPNLELLWMNHCKIAVLYPWAKHLQHSCPNLTFLSLMGNPAAPSYLNGGTFYEYLQYRLFIISLFPHLVHLDDRKVTQDQRMEAKRMFRRPLFERITSKTPQSLPFYFRSVTDKVSDFFSNPPPFTLVERNLIV